MEVCRLIKRKVDKLRSGTYNQRLDLVLGYRFLSEQRMLAKSHRKEVTKLEAMLSIN